MKRSLAIVLILLSFPSVVFAMALSGPMHLERNHLASQGRAINPYTSVNLGDYLRDSRVSESRRYLETKSSGTDFIVGKQSYTLGKGLIAGISEVCGIRTSFGSNSGRATFFLGDNGQPMLAGSVMLKQNKNLTLEASYFRIDSPFVGLSLSGKLAGKEAFDVETSENVTTQAKGYLFGIHYGQAERKGDVYASLSYRYIEPGAVSDYSVDADLDDSKGFRLETTYKLMDNLAFTFLRDFATTQENLDKGAVNATLTWDF